jgi:hypothetical protein
MRITFVTPVAELSGGARVIHIYAALWPPAKDVRAASDPVGDAGFAINSAAPGGALATRSTR